MFELKCAQMFDISRDDVRGVSTRVSILYARKIDKDLIDWTDADFSGYKNAVVNELIKVFCK
jgi:hypothetical protein